MARLTDKERAFCVAYVSGLNAGEAAIKAGYSAVGSRQCGYRLLQKPLIQAEIERLRKSAKPAAMKAIKAIVVAPALDGEVLTADEARRSDEMEREVEIKTEADLGLARAWVIQRMMRNAQICMGEVKVTTMRIAKASNGDLTVMQFESFERDAAGANQALALLSKELDRMEARGVVPIETPKADVDTGPKPAIRNPLLAEAHAAFQEKVRQLREETMAKMGGKP